MARLNVDQRLRREGLVDGGPNVVADGEMFHVDMAALTGRSVVVYGQQEVVRDLFDAAQARGVQIVFDAADVALHGLDTDRPSVT